MYHSTSSTIYYNNNNNNNNNKLFKIHMETVSTANLGH